MRKKLEAAAAKHRRGMPINNAAGVGDCLRQHRSALGAAKGAKLNRDFIHSNGCDGGLDVPECAVRIELRVVKRLNVSTDR
ncbi:MAG: hypothetical protein NUW01_01315 [Gemmatimonadaceae bacterium]|nr:hypothetical protein [Gemmatimonadaceae bacterium]